MKRTMIMTLIVLVLLAGAVAGARRGEDRAGTGRGKSEIATVAPLPRNDRQSGNDMNSMSMPPYPPPGGDPSWTPYPYPEPLDECEAQGGVWILPFVCQLPTPWWTPVASKTPELPTPAPVPTCPNANDPNCG